MSKVFFVSDTHFSHKSIIKYCPLTRGKYIDENGEPDVHMMNKDIVNNWNNIVSMLDTVYHLGDWCFNHNKRVEFIKKLNGTIKWVKGNHDKHPGIDGDGFYLGRSSFIIEDGYLYLLIHSPYDSHELKVIYKEMNLPIRVICGHVHEKWQFKKPGEYISEYNTAEHREKGFVTTLPILNVGLDANSMKILSFEDVKQIFEENM